MSPLGCQTAFLRPVHGTGAVAIGRRFAKSACRIAT